MNAVLSAEKQLQDVYQKVSPAIVRLSPDEDGARTDNAPGVIVTTDGVIVTVPGWVFNDTRKQQSPIYCFLPDGRVAKCHPLGWSEEWNTAILKTDAPGPWPHVEMDKTDAVSAGQLCVSLRYFRQPDQRHFEVWPQLRIGNIIRTSPRNWFSTSAVDGFTPVFSPSGQFLGIATYVGENADCTPAAQIVKHWNNLIEGKNLDRELLNPASHDAASKPASDGSAASPADAKVPGDDPDSPAVKAAIEKAASATVRICQCRNRFSGVIVTADGYIVTCAHHRLLPGEAVTIELSDGRDAQGKIWGVQRIPDIGLAKITDKGEWPHVEMGDSLSAIAGQPCWLIGYPQIRKERTPLIRQSSIAEPGDKPWSYLLYTSKAVQTFGGDSGGGVFDSAGRLIGSCEGQDPDDFARYHRIESYRHDWEYLTSGKAVDTMPGAALKEFTDAFTQTSKQLPAFVVEVLGDGKTCALGTIVGKEGKILTKASELYGAISVRLPDEQTLPATTQKYSRPLDLALLAIDTVDLPVPRWTADVPPQPGRLAAALVPGETPRIGVVACKSRAIPVDRGSGLADFRDTENGLEVVDDVPARKYGGLIRKGDIIRRVEGIVTPDGKAELALLGDGWKPGSLLINAGDPITVTVDRDKTSLDLRFPRPPVEGPHSRTESHRYAGFTDAFDVDIALDTKLCGGPVISIQGEVIGIAIAARGNDWHRSHLHVLPTAVIKKFIAE